MTDTSYLTEVEQILFDAVTAAYANYNPRGVNSAYEYLIDSLSPAGSPDQKYFVRTLSKFLANHLPRNGHKDLIKINSWLTGPDWWQAKNLALLTIACFEDGL